MLKPILYMRTDNICLYMSLYENMYSSNVLQSIRKPLKNDFNESASVFFFHAIKMFEDNFLSSTIKIDKNVTGVEGLILMLLKDKDYQAKIVNKGQYLLIDLEEVNDDLTILSNEFMYTKSIKNFLNNRLNREAGTQISI